MSKHFTLLNINHMHYKYRCRILSILVLSLIITSTSSATSTTVTNSNNGGLGSLRVALEGPTGADTVYFAPTVTTVNIQSGQILITRDVVIIGNGMDKTILKGNGTSRLLASNFNIHIQSLTMRDGKNGSGEAGAIFCGGTMVIKDVRFFNNEASSNGGAILLRGDMTLINVTLENNRTTTTSSGRGGAINIRSGTLTMENCRVINNRSEFSAGAISSLDANAKLFVNRSIFRGNSSPNGGGNIVMFGDTVSITNSLITGNLANRGGGLYFADCNVSIYNSTVAGNRCVQKPGTSSFGRGGGINIVRNSNIYMANTIVGNNTVDNTEVGPDIFFESNGTLIDLGGNLISDNTDINTAGYISPLIGTASSPIDPQFVGDVDPLSVPTSEGDYSLRCTSPAIDMGENALGVTMGVDIAGLPRLVNVTIDIGAYERPAQSIWTVSNIDDERVGSLRNAIGASCPGDTVLFDQMIDGEQIKLTTGQIEIDNNIVIFGNGPSNTIVDGNGTSRIFEINIGASAAISNMTIQNGNSTTQHFTGGGGIFNDKGTLKLSDMIITNCTATDGGGLFTRNGGTSEVQRCRFSTNSVTTLGGGLLSEGITTIRNSVISGNSAGQGGGGIYISNTASLTNVTISGNIELSESGGGILHDGLLLTMTHTIVAKNESSSQEKDIHKRGSVAVVTDDGYNLLGDTTGIGQPLAATTIFGTSDTPLDPIFFKNPDLDQEEPGDMRLRCTSPAINMGTPDTTGLSVGQLDFSGLPRVVNSTIDLGAHERPVETATREVVNNNDSGPGSLRDAIVTACAGDAVTFDASVDGQTIKIDDELVIDTNIDILGNGMEHTVIDGMFSDRIFQIKENVIASIKLVAIRNGRRSFSDNGGGILNHGVLTIEQLRIDNSGAHQGGGIYNSSSAILTSKEVLISENTSGASEGGGGIYNEGTADFISCAFSSNVSSNDGGGVFNIGTMSLINTAISGNEAGPFSDEEGGGIYNRGNLSSINTSIAGNRADNGGGIFNHTDGTLEITNTIIANNNDENRSDDILNQGTITDHGYNLIGDITGINLMLHPNTLFGDDMNPLDPLFLKDAAFFFDHDSNVDVREAGNLRLSCSSPAIDMGQPDTTGLGIGSTDQLGLPRIANGRIDMGAHERIAADDPKMVTHTGDSGLGSLRDEILSVCPGDTIFFDPTIDGVTIELINNQIVLNKDITIKGNGQDKTIIDGMDNHRIFYIDGITANISSLAIHNGNVQDEPFNFDEGGGIYVESGRLDMADVLISNCQARLGGGVYAADTTVLSSCTISSNHALSSGGGVYNSGSYVSMANSTIEHNDAGVEGGGIANASGTMDFFNTRVLNNSSMFSGGGINSFQMFNGDPAIVTFRNSMIAGNQTAMTENNTNAGGGMHNAGIATFINTVISANTSESGGGMANRTGATAVFTNSTIAGNLADESGGGIYNFGNAVITNTIIAENRSERGIGPEIWLLGGATITDGGNNFIGDASGVETHFDMSTLRGTASSTLNPKFVRRADAEDGELGDLRLWCNSLAVDAGTVDTTGLHVGLIDAQGASRVTRRTIDIGAYEYFGGQLGDLLLDGSRPISYLERATNITAQVGISELVTEFQAEETVTLDPGFEVSDGNVFYVQIAECPD